MGSRDTPPGHTLPGRFSRGIAAGHPPAGGVPTGCTAVSGEAGRHATRPRPAVGRRGETQANPGRGGRADDGGRAAQAAKGRIPVAAALSRRSGCRMPARRSGRRLRGQPFARSGLMLHACRPLVKCGGNEQNRHCRSSRRSTPQDHGVAAADDKDPLLAGVFPFQLGLLQG